MRWGWILVVGTQAKRSGLLYSPLSIAAFGGSPVDLGVNVCSPHRGESLGWVCEPEQLLLSHVLVQSETLHGHIPLCTGRGLCRCGREGAVAAHVGPALPTEGPTGCDWWPWDTACPVVCTNIHHNAGTSCDFTGFSLCFITMRACTGLVDSWWCQIRFRVHWLEWDITWSSVSVGMNRLSYNLYILSTHS